MQTAPSHLEKFNDNALFSDRHQVYALNLKDIKEMNKTSKLQQVNVPDHY